MAVLDSGVYFPAILGSAVGYNKNFTRTGDAGDWYGHGTFVAGVFAASGTNSAYKGVSPGVRIVSFKVLDDTGSGRIAG